MKRVSVSRGVILMTIGLYILTITLFLGRHFAYAEDVRGVTEDTIKIGIIADLTGPTAVDIAAPVVAGLKLLYLYTNEQGGINGRKIKLIIEDDRFNIPLALSAFKKLVFKEKVFAICGPLQVGGSVALMGQIAKNKVPQINYGPSKKYLFPVQRYIFSCVGIYDDDIKLIFEYIFEKMKEKPSIVGIVYPDLETGKTALRASLVEANRYGIQLYEEILNVGATDATSQVLNLKRKKVRHIIIHEPPMGVVTVLRAAYRLGLSAGYYGTVLSTSEDDIEMGGPAIENFIGSHLYSAWYEDTPGTMKLRELSRKYLKKVTTIRSRFSSGGFLGGMILNEGIKNAGRDLNHETLVERLESIKNWDTQDISGPVTYNAANHQGIYHRKLYKVDRDKKILVPISGWLKSKY